MRSLRPVSCSSSVYPINRTVTFCLSFMFSSACRTCVTNASVIGVVSSSYRSGTTRFFTRVRRALPSL